MMSPSNSLLSLLTLAALSVTDPPGRLLGRWQPKLPAAMPNVTVYRPNQTFDIFINGKAFVSGQYRFSGDTLAYDDPTCGTGYAGLYRLTFMGDDSLRLTLLRDTCAARSSFIAQMPTMGRVKTMKP